MLKKNLLMAGALALCIAFTAQIAMACDHDKASASAMSGACATKSSLASIFKDAPGTRTEFKKVNNGVALVVTASNKEYVPVVQNALLQHMDEMKAIVGQKASGACPSHSGASMEKTSSGSCPHSATEKASMEKTSSGSCAAHSMTEKASVEKTSGASCCMNKSGAKVSMTSADCPDWMKVLCTADTKVEKTSKGVKITWTSPNKDTVEQLRVAGEKFQAEIAQL